LCLQPGEDSVSYERHLKHLQGEFSKAKRNPQVVTELMTKTFPLRRAEILEQSPSLPKLVERFPFLQEATHLSHDLEWILDSEGEKERSRERWSETCSKVLQQGELEATNNVKLAKAIGELPDGTGEMLRALSLLPFVLPDPRCKVDPTKFMLYSLGCENIVDVARNHVAVTPCVLLSEDCNVYSWHHFLFLIFVIRKDVQTYIHLWRL
jgi:hypothetical protein